MPLPKSQKELICSAKVIEGPEALLGFTIIRVLFRSLIERNLFRVLSDRVFFQFSEIGSSFLRYIVTLFYQKHVLFAFILILKNN